MQTQANIPHSQNSRNLLANLSQAGNYFVHPPRILLASGKAFERNNFVAIRILQNCGTAAVKWEVMQDDPNVAGSPSPANDTFHGILAACAVADDGTGGVVDLSRLRGEVYISGSTVRVATFEASHQSPSNQSVPVP